MGKDGIVSFLKNLQENKECRDKAKGFGDDAGALAAYARELGYDVTPEELREYQEKARQSLKSKVLKYRPPDGDRSPGERAYYELIKLAETDKAVAKELAALAAGTPEEIVAYGREKGFTFTEQDMEAAGKSMLEQEDELSDEELEAAAGGTVLAFVVLVVGGLGAVAIAAGAAAAVVALTEA